MLRKFLQATANGLRWNSSKEKLTGFWLGKLVYARSQTLPPGIEVEYEKDYPSMIHMEAIDNRRALLEGSSGGPALNCAGKVSAIINMALGETYVSSKGKIVRRATKGTATNYGLPEAFVEELEARK